MAKYKRAFGKSLDKTGGKMNSKLSGSANPPPSGKGKGNPYHVPSGPNGGQFTSGPGGGSAASAVKNVGATGAKITIDKFGRRVLETGEDTIGGVTDVQLKRHSDIYDKQKQETDWVPNQQGETNAERERRLAKSPSRMDYPNNDQGDKVASAARKAAGLKQDPSFSGGTFRKNGQIAEVVLTSDGPNHQFYSISYSVEGDDNKVKWDNEEFPVEDVKLAVAKAKQKVGTVDFKIKRGKKLKGAGIDYSVMD
jgi:hypothetical protein